MLSRRSHNISLNGGSSQSSVYRNCDYNGSSGVQELFRDLNPKPQTLNPIPYTFLDVVPQVAQHQPKRGFLAVLRLSELRRRDARLGLPRRWRPPRFQSSQKLPAAVLLRLVTVIQSGPPAPPQLRWPPRAVQSQVGAALKPKP